MLLINLLGKSLLIFCGVFSVGGCGFFFVFLFVEVFLLLLDQQQYDDCCGSEDGLYLLLLGGVLFVEDGFFLWVYWYVFGGDDQLVGVDVIGGVGDECDQVFIWCVVQQVGFIWGDDFDVLDFVFQFFVCCGDVDWVVFFDLVEVVLQGGVLYVGVGRKCGELVFWWGGWDSVIFVEFVGCVNRQVCVV